MADVKVVWNGLESLMPGRWPLAGEEKWRWKVYIAFFQMWFCKRGLEPRGLIKLAVRKKNYVLPEPFQQKGLQMKYLWRPSTSFAMLRNNSCLGTFCKRQRKMKYEMAAIV